MTTMAMAWQAKPKPKTKDSFEKAKLTICNRVQNDEFNAICSGPSWHTLSNDESVLQVRMHNRGNLVIIIHKEAPSRRHGRVVEAARSW